MRLLILLLFCSIASIAQELQKGVVIPAVQLENSDDKSYALYLPNSYESSQSYPVVFVFDEAGMGAKAAQQFSIGANLTQSIIVAPNYIFSDSLNVSVKQSAQLINTIYQRLAVNKEKIILAGIGRGSIVASTNALLSSDVYGVIAINEVFIDEKLLNQNSKAKFVLLNKDTGKYYYNLKRIENLYSFREKLKGYYEFSSEDQWPDGGYLSAAMVDLLQNSASAEDIEKYYKNDIAYGTSLYKKRRHLEAYDFVFDLKKQYKKELDIDEQKELLKTVRGSSAYKLSKIYRNQARFDEQLLRQDILFFLDEDVLKAYFDNLGWWNYQMDEIDATIDSTASNAQQRKSALRLKAFTQSQVEQKYSLYAQNNGTLEQLLFLNILRTLVNPDNQEAFINIISLSAKEGDESAALFYLEELLRTGYSDYDSLYAIDGTTALRIGEEWNAIVKDYLGKSKYYDY